MLVEALPLPLLELDTVLSLRREPSICKVLCPQPLLLRPPDPAEVAQETSPEGLLTFSESLSVTGNPTVVLNKGTGVNHHLQSHKHERLKELLQELAMDGPPREQAKC